jgi:hypothetical protein
MKRVGRKTFLRWGALTGIAGLCAVLASREKKFKCSDRCGTCPKLENGKCGLGIK